MMCRSALVAALCAAAVASAADCSGSYGAAHFEPIGCNTNANSQNDAGDTTYNAECDSAQRISFTPSPETVQKSVYGSFSLSAYVKRSRISQGQEYLLSGPLIIRFSNDNKVEFELERVQVSTSSATVDDGVWVLLRVWGESSEKGNPNPTHSDDAYPTSLGVIIDGEVAAMKCLGKACDGNACCDEGGKTISRSYDTSIPGGFWLGAQGPDKGPYQKNRLSFPFHGDVDEVRLDRSGRELNKWPGDYKHLVVYLSMDDPGVLNLDSVAAPQLDDVAQCSVPEEGLLLPSPTKGKVCGFREEQIGKGPTAGVALDAAGSCCPLAVDNGDLTCDLASSQGSTCSLSGCKKGFGFVAGSDGAAPRTCQLTGQTWTNSSLPLTTNSSLPLKFAAWSEGETFCLKCPKDAVTVTSAATAKSACSCRQGTFGPGATSGSHKYITSGSHKCIVCPFPERCLGGAACTSTYGGAACTGCSKGYYTLVSSCFPCPEYPGTEYIAVTLVGIAAVYWTYHLADIEASSETLALSIIMLQEASLTFGIYLNWPQLLLDAWAWVSSIFNVNIAFSGPECLGDGSGGYAERWWTNAMAPVVLILLHGVVFFIRSASRFRGTHPAASQALGSFVLWCKLIFMMMMQLIFETWVCTPSQVEGVQTWTLDADPGIECPVSAMYDWTAVMITAPAWLVLCCLFAFCNGCEDKGPNDFGGVVANKGCQLGCCVILPGIFFVVGWIGMAATGGKQGALLCGSIILFIVFGIGFVGASGTALCVGDRNDATFRVKLGALFLAYEENFRLWFVGPITIRRTLLQFFATVLKKTEYTGALAGTAIAIHVLYGLSVAYCRPYTDTEEAAGASSFDDLDMLSIFHSAGQVLLLIVGLAANKENEVAITVCVCCLGAAAAIASGVVQSRIRAKAAMASRIKAKAVAEEDVNRVQQDCEEK